MSRKNKKVKKIHKIVICLLIAFVVGVASLFGTNAYVKSSVKDRIIPAGDATDLSADCILVLGARVYES
ncbi:MAG: SanA protein, partial [Oscillospiraceae bacterium]|nr:SanA protein [Oscillospiraceae bacterium]